MAASVGKQGGMEHVPSWDGQAKGWRRYVKEVQWYMLGTKPSLRPYLASRLITKLNGPARLLAMTWQLQEFNGPDGVRVLLSKLSKSPLVRKSLPNAASIMAQYFAFKRYRGEAISNFLIREALHYEEFRERLIRLKEEKSGVDPERDGFGLPTVDEESASEAPDSDAPTVMLAQILQNVEDAMPGFPQKILVNLLQKKMKHWSSWNAALTWGEDPWSYDSWWWNDDGEDEADAQAAQEDPNASDASAAEAQKMEQLLADGRSWSQAQCATAARKKDRGFGRAACFICGSTQHLAKDCPDRLAPQGVSKSKGKGKKGFYYVEDDWNDWIYAMQEGKGKSKSESYKGKFMDPWKGKGKGKAPVNAYALNHYGLEMELQAQQDGPPEHALLASKKMGNPRQTYAREIPPGNGMVDSGATCSAGPETSVQRLVTKIMEADAAAQIRVETKDQPRFRFGSGKWGQALYKLTISSSITGSPRSFSCFALPDPEERHEEWFTLDMLVPVLVGMDWLREAGAVLDFNDGHCFLPLMNGVVLNLPQNQKGHYMLDVVEYLTDMYSKA
eukprot:s2774_g8.t1